MRRNVIWVLLSVIMFCLTGCGGGGGDTTPTVSGVAAGGAAMANVPISLKDSATPVKELTTTSEADGSFTFNTTELTPPFILKAVSGGKNYYSLSNGAGTANISPYTTVVLAIASGGADLDALYTTPDKTKLQTMATNIVTALQSIQTKMQPILSLFDNGNNNPITDTFTANHSGLDALLDAVAMDVTGWVTVNLSNRATSNVFCTGSANNFGSGTFDQTMMPKPPVTLTITPSNASIAMNNTATFTATVTGSPVKTVTWSVVEVGGGTVTTGGVYTAPATAGTYTVKAVSDANPSVNATASVVVATNPPPTAPSGVSAAAGNAKVTISWNASAGATSYNLYYATTAGVTKADGTKKTEVSSPYDVTSLSNGTPYYFVVTAVNANGESAISTPEVSATPTLGQIIAPAMPTARGKHAQVTLQNGNVLITGGFSSSTFPGAALDTAVLYDSTNNIFTAVTGKMKSTRTSHTATLLPDGRVLLTGGQTDNNDGDGTNTAELYDPSTQSFTSIPGTMTSSRGGHAAVLLNNGTVLIMGGYWNSSTGQRTAEIYNPATNTFTALSNLMVSPRSELTANILPDGKVLVTGGESDHIGTNTAEIYDPTTGIFTAISATMTSIRFTHSGSPLPNGHILLSGGVSSLTPPVSAYDTAEDYNPSTQSFTTISKKMTSPRFGHASSLLADGSVFITGGVSSFNGTIVNVLNSAERFVP